LTYSGSKGVDPFLGLIYLLVLGLSVYVMRVLGLCPFFGSDAMWVTDWNCDGCDEDDDYDENGRPGVATSLIIIIISITPITVPFHPDCITT
jgi:hypothetical protein